MPDGEISEFSLDPRLHAWVTLVAHHWQLTGVTVADRDRLRTDLLTDLRQALADGASVDSLIAVEPGAFAGDLAAADGLGSGPARVAHAMTSSAHDVTALLGAVAGAVASIVLVYLPGLRLMDQLALTWSQQGAVALGLHLVAASVCVMGSVIAVRWRFRFEGGITSVAAHTGLSMAVGGALSVVPTMALASAFGYSSSAAVVVLEVAVVLAFCLASLRIGHRIATRAVRRPLASPGSARL